jgi:hypothetical protein
MPYRMEFDSKGFIRATAEGHYDAEQAVALCHESAALAEQHGVSTVLADLSHAQLEMQFTSVYRVHDMAADIFPPHFRVAALLGEDQGLADEARFAEDVSHNRGMDFHVFRSEPLAVAWLTGQTSLH